MLAHLKMMIILIIMIIIIILGGGQPLCVGVPPWENVERPTRDGLTPPLQVSRWSLSWSLMINYHDLWWIIIIINDFASDAKLWECLEQNFYLQGLWVRGWWLCSQWKCWRHPDTNQVLFNNRHYHYDPKFKPTKYCSIIIVNIIMILDL